MGLRMVLLVSVVLLAAVILQAGDWTQWRGSNRDLVIADEIVAETWPKDGPRQLWQIEMEGDGYSEPIIVDGRIYITGNVGDKKDRRGKIYCFNAQDGSALWNSEYGAEWGKNFERARTTPTYLGDTLYVISGLGEVVAMSASDGKVIWRVDTAQRYGMRNITWGIAESPLIYDGTLICQPGGEQASVVALDITDGDLIWKTTELSEKSAYCSPALLTINGKRQVVTSLEDHTVGLDAASGGVLWKYAYRNRHAVHPNTPVLAGQDRVFISSGYKYGAEVIEIKGNDVKQLWKEKASDNHFQGVAFYKGRIFSSGGGKLWCFDPSSGRAVYTVEEANKTSFCILGNGMMITYDEKGGKVLLLKVDENSYTVNGTFKITYGNDQHWSSPVVAHGVMYLRRGRGLAAFAVGK